MLRVRVFTALSLVAVLLPALFLLPQAGWALFAAVLAAMGGWEWGGLMRASPRGRLLGALGIAMLCAGWLALFPESIATRREESTRLAMIVFVPAVGFWLLAVPLWLRYRWRLPTGPAGWLVGGLVLFPPWLAIVQLRLIDPLFLLAVLAAVWVADIGAYFFGRLFGRHKLAPAISPGKTWEGALGGAAAVIAFGLAVREWGGLTAIPFVLLAWALPVTAAISVVGDLFESLLKRQVGLKDSSAILPGHGGVLDRIDSLTSALPFIALCWLVGMP